MSALLRAAVWLSADFALLGAYDVLDDAYADDMAGVVKCL